jgi:Acetyltransferase (GNAT) domain
MLLSHLKEDVAGTSYRVTSPAPESAWDDIMQLDPEALPYQSPGWTAAICAAHGFRDVSRYYEFEDGRRVVIPLVAKGAMGPIGLSTASLPDGCGMGGAISSAPVTALHLRTILLDLSRLSFVSMRIRPNPRQGDIWSQAAIQLGLTLQPRRAHVIDLTGGFEKVQQKLFSRDTRRQIRKAEQLGAVTRSSSGGELVPVLYGLLEKSVERWASHQREPLWLAKMRFHRRDPISKFYRIAETMGSACRIYAVWVKDTPVAAALTLFAGNANDARGALDRDAIGTSNANDLIQAQSIEYACQNGCRFFHMGESGSSEQLARFKERFGAEPYSYNEIQIDPFHAIRMENALKRTVKRVIGFRE